jgi:hypothetical protein
MAQAGHHGRQVVVYPISRRHTDPGRVLVNWVALHQRGAGSRWAARTGTTADGWRTCSPRLTITSSTGLADRRGSPHPHRRRPRQPVRLPETLA